MILIFLIICAYKKCERQNSERADSLSNSTCLLLTLETLYEGRRNIVSEYRITHKTSVYRMEFQVSIIPFFVDDVENSYGLRSRSMW